MMQVLRSSSGQVKAILSEGELVVGDREVADWFQNGVPSIRGAKRGDVITERPVRVKRSSPMFYLALLDLIEEEELELVEVVAKGETGQTYAQSTGAQVTHSSGRAGGGANLQLELPEKPTNPHDVQGVQKYLLDLDTPGDHVTILRDPSIYEFRDNIDWVWPIADAQGRAKNIVTPDETENRAEEHRATVERTQRQVTDVPPNQGVPRHTEWKPVQREAAERFPPEDDSERTIQKSKKKKRAVTIQEVQRGS